MKEIFIFSLFFILACTSTNSTWDGAQRQEVMGDTTQTQRDQQYQNQLPAGGRRDF